MGVRYDKSPSRSIWIDIAIRSMPMSLSTAAIPCFPSSFFIIPADRSDVRLTAQAPINDIVSFIFCSGYWLARSVSMAIAEGPAISGIARGTISGSWVSVGSVFPVGNTIFIEMVKRTMPPDMPSACLFICIADSMCSPMYKKASRIISAMSISLTMMSWRFFAGYSFNSDKNVGILPKGSIMSMSVIIVAIMSIFFLLTPCRGFSYLFLMCSMF